MPAYRTPGVYIEEISAGPRPVQASSTTDTGFVAILTLPASFTHAPGRAAAGLLLPAIEDQTVLTWNRALAFRQLLLSSAEEVTAEPPAAAAPGAGDASPPSPPRESGRAAKTRPRAPADNRLKALIEEVLPGRWDMDAPNGEDVITLRSSGDILRVPIRRSQVSTKDAGNKTKEWDLAFEVDEQQMLELIASKAVEQGIKHTGALPGLEPNVRSFNLKASEIQARMQKTAPAVHTIDAFEAWRREFAGELFMEILQESDDKMTRIKAESMWASLPSASRHAWEKWVRTHPGMLRLELAIQGFFQNGGKAAYVCLAVQTAGAGGLNRLKLLQDAFDGVKSMAMLAAPGLDFAWQKAILEYAGPNGRGDLFAVLETPRYLTTRAPRAVESSLNKYRWLEKDAPYEVSMLETLGSAQLSELRFAGYSSDEVLDRCVPRDETGFGAAYGPWVIVDNPLSTGAHDRYVIAPPSGHVAGVIAATDLKAGGGVHKAPANEQVMGVAELVTSISDREQEPLNMKGINIIRHRPGAGIRIWGARTVASDPLWTYINVRRLFLFVERSVRDAIQWAVFLPNSASTRGDLRTTIVGFLYRLYQEKMLDGTSWKDAFNVRCDETNNTDIDVRLGMLTVDVDIRPVFPAEFVRVRFRQSKIRGEIAEG